MSGEPLAAASLLQDVALANRILAREGVLDAFGHVSIRHPEQPDRYIIARSLGPEFVTPDDLQLFTLTGEQVGGIERQSYAERAIHGAIYEARPDVLAVCHNHSPSTIPFGVTGVPLKPIYHMASLLGMDVPVWDIADEFGDTNLLVRTMEQGRSLAKTLGSRRVALMRGHGSAVAGRSLPEIVMCCIYMEQNARLPTDAMAMGEVKYLSPAEAELMGNMLMQPVSIDRAWHAWRQRAGLGD